MMCGEVASVFIEECGDVIGFDVDAAFDFFEFAGA